MSSPERFILEDPVWATLPNKKKMAGKVVEEALDSLIPNAGVRAPCLMVTLVLPVCRCCG